MSDPKYEKLEDNVAEGTEDPPTYSEKQPYRESDPLKPPAGPSPLGYGAAAPMPNQYQPYYGLPGTGYNQDPTLQPPQVIIVRPPQPTNEPDYLAYSIFTMLCCCLPLGIAALVYSFQTREANNMGNSIAAQRNSRMARILANTALAVGIVFLIVYIVVVVITLKQAKYDPPNNL
ncbi:synapse differentiation-inducing gene protein 1-like [Elgaria multicarinata webbii]|uniref:synapse differentiation-inducing gene protein 1-like n=1 Tax=Elgaria multicarinata webbii TaxID=159646 RepID=UPI002FCD5F02